MFHAVQSAAEPHMSIDYRNSEWTVQRRDTGEYWCRDEWSSTPEWFDWEKVQDICRDQKAVPVALSARRCNGPCDDDPSPSDGQL